MGWFTALTGVLAPFFIIASPVLSYADQAMSMQRNKSSAGFSLDIPLIMLVASILRIFYWPGARYDVSLLVQSLIMVGMQVVLLKIALDHRPAPSTKGGEAGLPFASAGQSEGFFGAQRPYSFWQWRSPKPYWQFLTYMAAALVACELVLGLIPPIYALYSSLIGMAGLSIEATLPIPQILANMQRRSCRGLRLSVLASWLIGDTFKIFWFFTADTEIPPVFKICGCFQAACDAFLGVQFFMYGDESGAAVLNGLNGLNASTLGASISARFNQVSESLGQLMSEKEGGLGGEREYEMDSSYGRATDGRAPTPTRRPAPFQAKVSGVE